MEKRIRWYQRLNAELYYLIIINFVIIIVDYRLFTKYWELIEPLIIVLILLLLLRKNSRIVYKIEFDDNNGKLDIHYYMFVIANFVVSIPYSQLSFKYDLKSYGIGNVMNALIFFSSKKSVAEIREKNRIGWTKNEIIKIIDKLNIIQNEINN